MYDICMKYELYIFIATPHYAVFAFHFVCRKFLVCKMNHVSNVLLSLLCIVLLTNM